MSKKNIGKDIMRTIDTAFKRKSEVEKMEDEIKLLLIKFSKIMIGEISKHDEIQNVADRLIILTDWEISRRHYLLSLLLLARAGILYSILKDTHGLEEITKRVIKIKEDLLNELINWKKYDEAVIAYGLIYLLENSKRIAEKKPLELLDNLCQGKIPMKDVYPTLRSIPKIIDKTIIKGSIDEKTRDYFRSISDYVRTIKMDQHLQSIETLLEKFTEFPEASE
ncbi:MAG: hypothetical protein Q6351_010925 [Candidatus Njordarchaeum guaymaensis]